MKVWVLTAAALLLAQLSLAPAHVEALGDGAALPARQLGAGGPTDNHRPAGDGGDNEADDSHPQVLAEHHPGSGVPCKATGSGMQHPPSRPRRSPPQPFRSRSLGLSHHLKGYGKFNSDTHSCRGIQSRPCHKPSDCSGCLGLYTCRPPGTCGLKAVSRQRGGFLQSIQGHAIPEQRSSA
ncbi:uncharacterized protein LOC121106531 isoform X2 [Gallus gallus]|uniref:uncharacterized protein LOC121106531 isoform X2 n=1 Tax=Gallus gallus TaxID=9031 RepID=UPI001AE28A40|nr:uncharacterized protein LOC121106531 isoform X2 [Gallus gallus]